MPEPSPTTNPSRSRSQGREAFSGSSLRCESARMAANPPIPMGVMQASAPPQIIASASSRWMILNESPMEWALVVQAVAVAEFGPFRAGADGNVARGQVDDGSRNEKRRDAAGAFFEQIPVLALDDFESADAAADDHADAFGVLRIDLEAGLRQRKIRGRDTELDKAAHFLDFFAFDELGGIEILHLSGDAAAERRGVKLLDP